MVDPVETCASPPVPGLSSPGNRPEVPSPPEKVSSGWEASWGTRHRAALSSQETLRALRLALSLSPSMRVKSRCVTGADKELPEVRVRNRQTIRSDEQGCGEAFGKGVQNTRQHVDGGLHLEPPGKRTLKPQPVGRPKRDVPAPAGAEKPARGAAVTWLGAGTRCGAS